MLTKTEIVGTMIYGSVFAIFLVGSAITIWIWKWRDIRLGLVTPGGVAAQAVMGHLAAGTTIYMMLKILSYFYRSTSGTLKPDDLAALFFKVDWAGTDMRAFTAGYHSIETGIILILKFEQMTFDYGMAFALIFFVIGMFFYSYIVGQQLSEHTSLMNAMLSVILKQSLLIFVVIAHIAIVNTFLVGLDRDTKPDTEPKIVAPLHEMPMNFSDRITFTLRR